jgi:hypothetical protein
VRTIIKFDKSKVVKDLAQGRILAPYIEKAFESFDDEFAFVYKPKVPDTAFHPSSDCIPPVSFLCATARDQIEPNTGISGALKKTFLVGHFWHALIQQIIVQKLEFASPDAIEREGKRLWGDGPPPDNACLIPRPYHWVHGYGDVAPLVTPTWKGVVDIKTMRSADFMLLGTGGLPAWAALKYKAQLNIYMDLFDQERGLILAVNKDSPHDFFELEFERDQLLIDSIYQKWRAVSDCLDHGIVPTEEDDAAYVLVESE